MYFLNENFLLDNEISRKLYHSFGESLPIIDYHCHISPKEIAQNKQFNNITQLWLSGDHYKWRVMRASGVDEKYITGDGDDYDKFLKWIEIMPNLIGSPLYTWSCLELKRYFDYDDIINYDHAYEIWNLCNEKLSNMKAWDIIHSSNVKIICTTDDPVDSLQWHKNILESPLDVKVLPAWRPDKLFSIEHDDFANYMEVLSDCTSSKITDITSLLNGINIRLDFFNSMGCKISDHSFSHIIWEPCSLEDADNIFQKRLLGNHLSTKEINMYKTFCLLFLADKYNTLNWTMQIHYGVARNVNSKEFNTLGPDSGFDSIGNPALLSNLRELLNYLYSKNQLPKTIIYSLNPNDNEQLDSIVGCFQKGTPLGRVQHGAAWWFNDNKDGIIKQLTSLGNNGVLGNFIGMLTDSRSFLSYTRHEYFRRIFCNIIGTMVDNAEYPYDEKALKQIIENVFYYNTNNFFEF